MQLVRRAGEQVGAPCREVGRHAAHPLGGVGVQQHLGGATDARDVRDGLQYAGLVVGRHHAQQGDLAAALRQHARECLDRHQAVRVVGQPHHLGQSILMQALAQIANRRMLQAAGHQHASSCACERAADGQVRRLRSSAGEHQFAIGAAKQLRDLAARQFHLMPCSLARAVDRTGVGPGALKRCLHGVHHLGQRLRGGIGVQVDHATSLRSPKSEAGPTFRSGPPSCG